MACARAGEMDARRADFNRSGISGLLCCGGQLFVIVVQPLPAALAHPLSSTFPSSQLHARSFCFPRFTFDPFFFFALDVLRWADTCILVSSLRRSIFAKGTYLKLTFRESRALFGAPFFLSPAFSPSTLVFCRLFTSLPFSLSLFRPFPSSLRNESCIRFFRSTILIPVVNFPFLSPSLSFSLYFSVFFYLSECFASSSFSAELLFQLLAHLYILVSLFLVPSVLLSSFSCSMSRSRVKPSATTGSADEKGISSLSLSLSSHSSVLSVFQLPRSSSQDDCAWSREGEERRCGARRRSSFLNLSWDNRLGVII